MIRKLVASDAAAWQTLWVEALKYFPDAFALTREEAQRRAEQDWADEIERRSVVFGAFDNTQLVASAAYYLHQGAKRSHRAELFAVFVLPAFQRRGLMRALLIQLLEYARASGIEQMHLEVNTTMLPAIACYEQAGFTFYGTKPHTLKIDERYIDTHMMIKYL